MASESVRAVVKLEGLFEDMIVLNVFLGEECSCGKVSGVYMGVECGRALSGPHTGNTVMDESCCFTTVCGRYCIVAIHTAMYHQEITIA